MNGVLKGLKILSKNKFLIIVITNQSGIGRGLFKITDFKKITDHMKKIVNQNGSNIDDIYFCPHHPIHGVGNYKKNCNCRKPKPGLIKNAISNWSINTNKSFMIGDKISDKKASEKCKIKFFYKKMNRLINKLKKF